MLLVIKGTRAEALRACVARGITEILATEEHPKYPETYITTYDRHWLAVSRWFMDPPHQAPFPAGTCLFYSKQEQPKAG